MESTGRTSVRPWARPGKRRPVVIVQAEAYNRSGVATVVAVAVTSKTALAGHSGNVFLPSIISGLPHDSVVNATTLTTFNRYELEARVGTVPVGVMREVDEGLRRVLDL